MQQKQDRLYKETVEAVANDDDGKLEKKDSTISKYIAEI